VAHKIEGYLRVTLRIHLRDTERAEKEIRERLSGKTQQIYYGRLNELIRRLHERYPGVRKRKIEDILKELKTLSSFRSRWWNISKREEKRKDARDVTRK